MDTNVYRYSSDTNFILSNDKTEKIIKKNNIWSILKYKDKAVKIALSSMDDEDLLQILTLDINSFEMLKKNSVISNVYDNNDKPFTVKSKTKDDLEVEILYQQTMQDINAWLIDFYDQISNCSIGANYNNISQILSNYLDSIKTVLVNKNINGKNTDNFGIRLSSNNQKIIEKRKLISKECKVDLNGWDHGLRNLSFKYIPSLEKITKKAIKEAINFSYEKDYDLTVLYLSDALDYMKINYYLQNADISKAINFAHNLDTAARDEFSSSFWEKIVIYYLDNPEKLSRQEIKCNNLIKIKQKEDISNNLSNENKKFKRDYL